MTPPRVAVAFASVVGLVLPTQSPVVAESVPYRPARSSTTSTPCDQMGRIVTRTTRHDGRRTTVDFRLAGAFPVQRYSFEVEFRYPGTVGNAVGAGTTNLHGALSLGGTGFPRRMTARYTVTAVSATDSCRDRGVVRPAAR